MTTAAARRIAFQGELGAYSHQACREAFPEMEPFPCTSFEEAIAAVRGGEAKLAMLPVENSLYGRVADIHHLLPESGLYIIGEHFVPIRLQLLGVPGARLDDVREAQSHTVALGQCRRFLKDHAIKPVIGADTAGSAQSGRRARRDRPRCHRLAPRRRDLRAGDAGRGRRGRLPQHHPLPGDEPPEDRGRPRRAHGGHDPSCSMSATCRLRSTRRWGGFPTYGIT
jgi:Prephenate dehydratase